jgi:hypothetical protein
MSPFRGQTKAMALIGQIVIALPPLSSPSPSGKRKATRPGIQPLPQCKISVEIPETLNHLAPACHITFVTWS